MKLMNLANTMMIAGCATFAVAIAGAYGFEQALTLPLVVAAHILGVVAPAFIKLGYVARLWAEHHEA
jgi:hypothetical protein